MSRRMGLATALALTIIVGYVLLSAGGAAGFAGRATPESNTPVIRTEYVTASDLADSASLTARQPAAGPTTDGDRYDRDDDDDGHSEDRRGRNRGHDDDDDDDRDED